MAAYKVWISWCQTYLQILLDAKKQKTKITTTTTTKHHCPSTVDLMSGAVGSSTRLTETMDSPVVLWRRCLWQSPRLSHDKKKHRPHINYRDATLQEVRKHLQSGESDHRQVLIWTYKLRRFELLEFESLWKPSSCVSFWRFWRFRSRSDETKFFFCFFSIWKSRPIISSHGIRWQGKDKIIQAFLLFSPPEMKSGGLMEL